jgi:hypothetical protein
VFAPVLTSTRCGEFVDGNHRLPRS